MSLLDQWKELRAAKKAEIWEDKEREWEEKILEKMKTILEHYDPSEYDNTHTLEIKTETEAEADHLVAWCERKHSLRACARDSRHRYDSDKYPYYVTITWDD